ncbi:MAG: hypothetical protein GC204_09575 [Chloroflexi bacterium]|nr:hypothetical protein [Chloroflexota bacterium]
MDAALQTALENIRSNNKDLQNDAYSTLLTATDQPVDWAYEVWDDLLRGLTDKDNHVRAIAAQILSGLAKSDPDQRMVQDFPALLAVTRDERFVTARHCLQSLWKVGVAGKPQQQVYLDGMETRFNQCASEKNCTLIRYDIAVSLRNVYDVVKDEAIHQKALALIESETDLKYRKKYAGAWKIK